MRCDRNITDKPHKGGNPMKCPFCGAQDTKSHRLAPADDNSSDPDAAVSEECGKRLRRMKN